MGYLNNLALKHGSGKARLGFGNSTYLDVYEKYLSHLQDKKINLFEIGVYQGSSLKMWAEYFRNGTIYAIDINPDCSTILKDDKINISICSQDDKNAIDIFCGTVLFDVVVDDGSHINELTLKSFDILWPKVRSGGLYIIEDLETSYMNDLNFVKQSWPGMIYNRCDLKYNNYREQLNTFIHNHIFNIDFKKGDVKSIHFHHQMCIIEKI